VPLRPGGVLRPGVPPRSVVCRAISSSPRMKSLTLPPASPGGSQSSIIRRPTAIRRPFVRTAAGTGSTANSATWRSASPRSTSPARRRSGGRAG